MVCVFNILSALAVVVFVSGTASSPDACPQAQEPSTGSLSEAEIEHQESSEAKIADVELLQHKSWKDSVLGIPKALLKEDKTFDQVYHRYLQVRPCERWAGDGRSGLPRHRVTGECCGDGVCATDRWEDDGNCPRDCTAALRQATDSTKEVLLPPVTSTLFGPLSGVEHDEYHCEDQYNEELNEETRYTSCSYARVESEWLEDLLDRRDRGELPFELPPQGSVAVEIGCGLGQDSRNIAKMAGYTLTAVDVSASGIEQAKALTDKEMLGVGPGQIEFIAYDAFALPKPTQHIDFFFDATVYCGLRHSYLSKDYDLWARLLTPGRTLVNIQCWAADLYQLGRDYHLAEATRRDMEYDFEPIFDVLHSEECVKNQGGYGWCFFMKLRSETDRKHIADSRLKLQQAARDGNLDYIRSELGKRSNNMSHAEYITLSQIARENEHMSLKQHLDSLSPKREDAYFTMAYGPDQEELVAQDDLIDGQSSVRAKMDVAYMKSQWERAELGEYGDSFKPQKM